MITTRPNESEDDYNKRKQRFEMRLPFGNKPLIKAHHRLILISITTKDKQHGLLNFYPTPIFQQTKNHKYQ